MIHALIRKSFLYSGSLVVARVISFIAFILFARHLGPELFGQYVLFITLVQIITFIADAGLGQWYQKQVTDDTRHHVFARALAVRTITYVLSSIIALFTLFAFFDFSRLDFILFSVALFFEGLLSIGEYFYFEKQESHFVGLKQIGRALLLIVFYYMASRFFTITTALYAYITAGFLTALWFFPWRSILHIKKNHFTGAHKVIKTAYPYALLSLTSLAYARADSLIIGYFAGSVAVGIYATAYRFLEALSMLPQSLAQHLFPISAKKIITKQKLVKLTGISAAVGGLIGVIIFFLAKICISFFFGGDYASAIPILQILAGVLFMFFINAPIATVVQSSHLVKKFLPFGVINTIANVVLNIIFIPTYGIQAAAWVMLFTEVTGLVINIFFIKQVYDNNER